MSQRDIQFAEGFEWDEGNIHKNRLKHGVDTNECEQVLFNSKIILKDKVHTTKDEKRYIVLGITNNDRKLALAVTTRGNKIRVIMARDQSRKERLRFNKKYQIIGGKDQ
jgi:uncharacterized DUF497 family protein